MRMLMVNLKTWVSRIFKIGYCPYCHEIEAGRNRSEYWPGDRIVWTKVRYKIYHKSKLGLISISCSGCDSDISWHNEDIWIGNQKMLDRFADGYRTKKERRERRKELREHKRMFKKVSNDVLDIMS